MTAPTTTMLAAARSAGLAVAALQLAAWHAGRLVWRWAIGASLRVGGRPRLRHAAARAAVAGAVAGTLEVLLPATAPVLLLSAVSLAVGYRWRCWADDRQPVAAIEPARHVIDTPQPALERAR